MKNLSLLPLILFIALVSCNNSNKKETQNDIILEDSTINVVMPYDTFSYNDFNEIANFLAGVNSYDSTSNFSSLFENTKWQNYSNEFTKEWAQFDQEVLNIVETWALENLTHTDSMFYPFSGPDFNYLNALFPNTKHSVLIGLEKPGSIPKINSFTTDQTASFLDELRTSLFFNLEYSYFRTKGMAKELNTSLLDGTIPLLMLFIKKHDFEIVNIYPVDISENGTLIADTANQMYARNIDKRFPIGVAIIYKDSSERIPRELVYLSLDISNGAIDTAKFDSFFDNYISGKTSFLKAASYLCHMEEFSIIIEHLLSKSSQIVTDPSGMPYGKFDNNWDVTIHGNYVGPINLFWGRMQKDLRDTCKNRGSENLPFHFGYHYNQWCMIDAKKK